MLFETGIKTESWPIGVYHMTEKQKEILTNMYEDPLLFSLTVLSAHFYKEPGQIHKEIFKQISKEYKFQTIVAPRGIAKSTCISLSYVLHQVCFQRVKFVIILSDTYTQAKEFLDAIKKEIETNEILKSLFGQLVGDTWKEGEIVTSTGIKIVAKGSEMKIRGLKFGKHRPDLIIIDDLENDELVESKDRREKLEKWYFGSVIPALSENGRILIIGTILHYDSLLNKLSKSEEYHPLFYSIIMNGKSVWPARYSIESINDLKESYTKRGLLDVFQCEYMNQPITNENAIFKQEYFRYFELNDYELIKTLNKFIIVDPAISKKETADDTVILVAGISSKNAFYILEYINGKMDPGETINNIFQLADKWHPAKIGIESVAYQKSLVWFLSEEMKRRNKFYIIEELKADADKERRIRGLQPRYKAGMIYHTNLNTALEEQLLLFPKSPHDDITDAVAYIPQIAYPGRSLKEPRINHGERTNMSISNNTWSMSDY